MLFFIQRLKFFTLRFQLLCECQSPPTIAIGSEFKTGIRPRFWGQCIPRRRREVRAGWYAHGDGSAREEGGNGRLEVEEMTSCRKEVALWGGTSVLAGLHGGNDVTNTDHDRFITSAQVPQAHIRSRNHRYLSLCRIVTTQRRQGRSVACRTTSPLAEIGLSPRTNRNSHGQILLDRKYYNADHNRRKVIERGPGVVNDQLAECKGFSVTLLLSSVRDAENQDCRSIGECSRPACDAPSEHSHLANEVESECSLCAGDAATEYSHSISQAGANYVPETTPSTASH